MRRSVAAAHTVARAKEGSGVTCPFYAGGARFLPSLQEGTSPHTVPNHLDRDAERFRDLLEDLCRWLAKPAFDLAQVRIRDARDLREPTKREPGGVSLLADEFAEVGPTVRRLADAHPALN